MEINFKHLNLEISVSKDKIYKLGDFLERKSEVILGTLLAFVSFLAFLYFYKSGLSLAYNDARSHLDIARRVVEGLKTGLAQLGSVWLPLPHILMLPTIWIDFFWHTGLSGSLISIFSFIFTSILIYKILKKLNVFFVSRVLAVFVFATNLNILYLSSTSMTEMLFLLTSTYSIYYLISWSKKFQLLDLIKCAFWVMLSTLTRYDGWFLLLYILFLIFIIKLIKRKVYEIEGHMLIFLTLAGFGIFLWFVWNLIIFRDPLYFIYGPYSAHTQQLQLEKAGELPTKGNLLISLKAYTYALLYNSYTLPFFLGILGIFLLFFDKKLSLTVKIVSLSLLSSFLFNVISLYLGHSVLFLPGVVGKTWFNIRYGAIFLPSLVIGLGYLTDRLKSYFFVISVLTFLVIIFSIISKDAVTIDDALYGASQKNVYEVSSWLNENAKDKEGYILISAASHDAIIFSSKLPMKRFIHEGTGAYWDYAVENPEKWARWIVMRTNDLNDLTFKEVHDAYGLKNFELIGHYPLADIYQLKDEYLNQLITKPILK